MAKRKKKDISANPARDLNPEVKGISPAAAIDEIVESLSQTEEAADLNEPVESGNLDKSGVPKNFVIKCANCHWSRTSSGISSDLADLVFVKPNCSSCGKWRRYRCPKCGTICHLKRIKGNR